MGQVSLFTQQCTSTSLNNSTNLNPSQRYHLAARLKGHAGPVNCFAFTRNGELLASGGDDEVVRIWVLKTKKCRQVLQDHGGRWGQITSLKWIPTDTGVAGGTLCFGTGRGILLVYRWGRTGVCTIWPFYDMGADD